ncbi:MAG: ribonuclease, partial [Acidobacteriaceae bacterium]
MAKEICISTTPHETRLAILEDDQLAEIYYERENEYTLAGSVYKGKVTRVLPGMQSAFVDVGLERDAFLYVTDFLEEQEESEEYERVDAGNGRERRPGREGGGRESREAREP